MNTISNNLSVRVNTKTNVLQTENSAVLKQIKTGGIGLKTELEPALASKKFYISNAISDGFSPDPFYEKHQTSMPNHYSLDSLFQNMSSLALDMLPILQAQSKSLQAMTQIQTTMLELMDGFSKMLHDLAEATVQHMDTEYEDAMKKIREETRKSGLFGMLFGLIEAVVGVVTIAVAGESGIGIAIGAALIADGLAKTVSSCIAAVAPEFAEEHQELGFFMQDGLFGAFDFADKSAGQKAQMAFAFLTLIATGGESFLSLSGSFAEAGLQVFTNLKSLIGLLCNAGMLVNLGFMSYGIIDGLIKQIQAERGKMSSEDSAQIGETQVMGMGFFAWALYSIEKATGLDKVLKDKIGGDWSMVVEMATYFAGTIVGSLGLGYGASQAKLAENFQKLQTKVASFTKILNIGSAVTQLSSASYSINAAMLNQVVAEQSSTLALEQVLVTLNKEMINQRIAAEQGNISQLNKDMQGIAASVDNFKQQLGELFQHEINFNARYALIG